MSNTKLKLKKSSISGRVPGVSDLDYGELAINYADGKLYYRTSSDTIKSFTAGDVALDSAAISSIISSDVDSDYVISKTGLTSSELQLLDGLSSDLVTVDGTQTLSNKTLESATLNSPIFGDSSNSPRFTEIRFNNSNIMKFNQMYTGASSGSYFTNGEYQKVVTITPDGNSQNYQVVGRITAQNANDVHTVYFNAGLRSNTLPDLNWSIRYYEEYNGNRYIDPQLWTKETTTAQFIFAFKTLATIYGTVTVDFEVIPRTSSQLANVSTNTEQNSEQSSVDTGFTANDMTRTHAIIGDNVRLGAYTFPTADGNANQVLGTNGSGTLQFVNQSSGLDSAGVTGIVDSAYVANRQDFSYGSLTGVPSSFAPDGVDSGATNALIDAAFTARAGTANEIMVVDSTGNDFTTTDILTIDASNNYVGINETSPQVTLHMTGEAAQTAQIRMDQHNNSGDAPDFRTHRSRGTKAAPTATAAGDFIYRSNHAYYNGTEYRTIGQFAVDASSANAERFQLTLGVSDDGGAIDAADAQFKIDGNASGAITFNNAFTFPTSDGTANYVLQTDGSGQLSWVAQDGGLDSASVQSLIDSNFANDVTFGGAASFNGTGNSIIVGDTLRIDSAGSGFRMTNIGAFDRIPSTSNFRMFSNNDLVFATNGSNGTALTLDTTTKNATFEGDIIVNAKTLSMVDSADVQGLVDSAYVQARQTAQDFSYSSLTGAPNVLDSAHVTNIVNEVEYFDSGRVSAMIDAADTFDSARVSAMIDAADTFDSIGTIALIDSAYIQARQSTTDLTNYRTVTQIESMIDSNVNAVIDAAPGALNTLNELAAALGDDANFSTTITNSIAEKVDSAQVVGIVDSAYVQARQTAQDFAYGSLTGVPSTFAPDGVDSAATIALIDSAYIQARQTIASFDSSSAIGLIDSAYVQARQVDLQRDSAFVTGLIDSDYVFSRVSETNYTYQLGTDADSNNANGLLSKSLGSGGSSAIRFNADGSMFFVNDGRDIEVWNNPTTAYDVSTYSRSSGDDNTSLTGTIGANNISDFGFSSDGTKMYIINSSSVIWQFELSTAFDVTTASYTAGDYYNPADVGTMNGFGFSDDGYKLILSSGNITSTLGTNADGVRSYTLSTAWDVTTATYDNKEIITGYRGDDYERVPMSSYFTNNGKDFFIYGQQQRRLQHFPLATAYDITSYTTRNQLDQMHNSGFYGNNGTIVFSQNKFYGIGSTELASVGFSSTGTKVEFNDLVKNLIDSDYIVARAPAAGLDSAATTALIDSAYILARAPAQDFLDSGEAINLIDSAYVQARQSTTDLTNYRTVTQIESMIDSNVNAVIDAAPGALNTLNELAAALGDDANFSTTITNSIAEKIDSAAAIALITSYGYTTYDSANTLGLIDSAYIQARQVDLQRDSGFVTGIVDSAYVALHSAIGKGDVDFGSNKITYSNVYSQLSDLPSASDYHGMFAHVHATGKGYFAHGGNWVELANNSQLANSSNWDTAYGWGDHSTQGYLTSAIDSANVIALVDSAYVQARQTSGGGGGLDSAATTALIDSAYINNKFSLGSAGQLTLGNSVVTADSGQTSFTGLDYNAGNVLVFLNGVHLQSGVDYTATNGTSLTLTTAADSGDELAIIDLANLFTIPTGATTIETYNYFADSGQTAFTGADQDGNSLSFQDSNASVYLNGILLVEGNDYTLSNNNTVTLVSGADSGDTLAVQAYVTTAAGLLDSAATINLIDSAYINARVDAVASGTDSSTVSSIILADVDSAYVQARQSTTDLTNYRTVTQIESMIDSNVNAVIDAAPGALNTLNELAAALGDDANFSTTVTNSIAEKIDSAAAVGIITSYGYTTYDSANTLGLIDSAYVQSRQTAQDFSYSSLTGVPSTFAPSGVDSSATFAIIDSAYIQARQSTSSDFDSASAISLIDSAYIQARQVDLQRDSGFVTGIVDSAYVQSRQTAQDFAYGSLTGVPSTFAPSGVDSSATFAIIDSAYIQARQTTADLTNYRTVTQIQSMIDSEVNAVIDAAPGALNTLNELAAALGDDANFSTTITNSIAEKVDSDQVIALIDSAYINARVTASAGGLDSAAVIDLIDSDYIGDRTAATTVANFYYTADSGQTAFTGADDQNNTLAYSDAGLQVYLNGILLADSADYTQTNSSTITLTEAADVNDIITITAFTTRKVGVLDSAGVTSLVDAAYVQARQTAQDFAYSSLTGAPNVLDSANVNSLITSYGYTDFDSAAATGLIDSAYISARTPESGVDSATTLAIVAEPKEFGGTTTYTVTVASKTSGHIYNGTGSSSGYFLDGIETPFIEFVNGQTYVFDQADTSNSSHQIRFYYDVDKTTEYTSGVTIAGTAGNAGSSITIVVDDDTPSILYYQCENHDKMGWAAGTHNNNVTGLTTDDLTEGTTNRYFSNTLARGAFTGGTGVSISGGSISIGQPVGTSDNVSFGNLTLSGNLTVQGSTTYVQTETLTVDDNIIELNSNVTGTPTENGGIEINRGTSSNVSLIWDEDSDNWKVTTDGSTYSKILTLADTVDASLFDGESSGYYRNYSNLVGAPTSITSFGITDGNAGQVLTTDGSGNFTFTTVSGSGGGGIDGTTGVTQFKSTSTGSTLVTTSAGTFSDVQVFVNGILQRDSDDYAFNDSSGNITFVTAPETDAEITVYGYKTSLLNTDSDDNLTINGDLKVGNHSNYTSGTVTLSANSEGTINSFDASTVRGAKFVITVENDSDRYQISEALVIHDGTTATITTYGTINTGTGNLAVFDAEYSSGTININATPTTVNTTYKVVRTDVVI